MTFSGFLKYTLFSLFPFIISFKKSDGSGMTGQMMCLCLQTEVNKHVRDMRATMSKVSVYSFSQKHETETAFLDGCCNDSFVHSLNETVSHTSLSSV